MIRSAALATLATIIALDPVPAGAGPTGGTVVGGSATISGDGSSSVTINQTSQNAAINWSTFNIGAGETATFNQLNSSSIALNRVIGGFGPSVINGTLSANGRVFVVNGDGVLIGRNASINTAGFLATTHDVSSVQDFMNGIYNFNGPGNPSASIVNLGHITAASGGFAALVAPGVRNSGTITATLGTVALASGNAFTLDMYGDKLITLAVNDQIATSVIDVATGKPLKSLVSNTGMLKANGGRVELTAAAARAVVDSVINNKGVIEANTIGTHKGMIVLGAATGASKPAGAPVQTVKLSGKISAAGGKKGTSGGTVVVTGENIELAHARINASGQAGGGTVLIGGDTGGGNPSALAASIAGAGLESFAVPTATTVSVDGRSTIDASATGAGNGGKVVVWSNLETTFAGTIFARGGAAGGNGGFVETSSHGVLNFAGTVDTRAPAGLTGNLLLDPYDLTICNTDCQENISSSGGAVTPTGDPSFLEAGTLESLLAGSNVLVTTGGAGSPGTDAGNITVNAAVTWSSGTTLTLSAYKNIIFDVGSLISNTGAGNLVLRADNSGTGSGNVQFITSGPPTEVDFSHSTGNVSIYYNPFANPDCGSCTKYENPTDFSTYVATNGAVPNQLTSYMLVNDAADLQGIGHNNFTLAQTYALGTNVVANSFTGFASGATFTGLLDGNGGLGTNYAISNLTLTSAQSQDIGLFPVIGSGSTVRNLTLSNVNVTAGANNQDVGALAGENDGTISNVTITGGSVSGGSFMNVAAGGLAGQNTGTISSAQSAASVSGARNSVLGGLVGASDGAVYASSASGPVSGTSSSYLGGLIGINIGLIRDSFTVASASVTGSGGNDVAGGLVGLNLGLVDPSTSAGNVAAGPNSIVGGLVGANATFTNFLPGSVSGTFPVGAVADGSAATGDASGGPGSVVGLQIGASLPNSGLPSFPSAVTGCGNSLCFILASGTFGGGTDTDLPSQTQLIADMTRDFTLAAYTPPNVVDTTGLNQATGTQQPLPPPGTGGLPPQFGNRFFVVPPPGAPYVKDEVVLHIPTNIPFEELQAIMRRLGLTILGRLDLDLLGVTTYRLHIDHGSTVASVIRALASYQIIAGAQANYLYGLAQDARQDPAQDPDLAGRTQEGDAAQYALGKLGLPAVHQVLKGDNITIAVIDSQVDVNHPDLDGVVADQFDAVGQAEPPHPHGTGMVGAIAAHRRLMGIAPSAKIYAIHAFSSSAANAESTTFNILKGLNWAAAKGVRVINMSFAGPRDPSMERALHVAHDRDIVLIAAAGNAGPKSPPLFPGADPDVIAVTATDINDKVFSGANRGKYIAVAAPGVDILVPAPAGTYQLTTGTSVASAEVSGIAALLLERDPNLTPEDIRKILTSSARHPAGKERDDDFGWGLVDPSKAIEDVNDLKPVARQPTDRRP